MKEQPATRELGQVDLAVLALISRIHLTHSSLLFRVACQGFPTYVDTYYLNSTIDGSRGILVHKKLES